MSFAFNQDFCGEELESVTRHPAAVGATVLAALEAGSKLQFVLLDRGFEGNDKCQEYGLQSQRDDVGWRSASRPYQLWVLYDFAKPRWLLFKWQSGSIAQGHDENATK